MSEVLSRVRGGTALVGHCDQPVRYKDRLYYCSLPLDHPGPCRTWIEEVDLEDEPSLAYEPPEHDGE